LKLGPFLADCLPADVIDHLPPAGSAIIILQRIAGTETWRDCSVDAVSFVSQQELENDYEYRAYPKIRILI
jgi:hypothetical protein